MAPAGGTWKRSGSTWGARLALILCREGVLRLGEKRFSQDQSWQAVWSAVRSSRPAGQLASTCGERAVKQDWVALGVRQASTEALAGSWGSDPASMLGGGGTFVPVRASWHRGWGRVVRGQMELGRGHLGAGGEQPGRRRGPGRDCPAMAVDAKSEHPPGCLGITPSSWGLCW